MATTPNIGLDLPVDTANIDTEIYRLLSNLQLLDTTIGALQTLAAGKAPLIHLHEMNDVVGLVTALNNKMAATKTFALSDLTDTRNIAGAPAGYILVKQSDGKVEPVSAPSVFGTFLLRIDSAQALTEAQKSQAIENIFSGLTESQKVQAIANIGVSEYMVFVRGLILSNNPGTPASHIDIGIGSAQGNGKTVFNAASLTKRLNAVWAAGSGNGGLDTGVFAIATYHWFAIRRDSDGAFDALASISATAPTVPPGWSVVQRIGAVLVTTGPSIVPFKQTANWFITNQTGTEIQVTSNVPFGLSTLGGCPNGVSVLLKLLVGLTANPGSTIGITTFDPGQPMSTLGRSRSILDNQASGGSIGNQLHIEAISNTSRQFVREIFFNGSGGVVYVYCNAWEDYSIPRVGG